MQTGAGSPVLQTAGRAEPDLLYAVRKRAGASGAAAGSPNPLPEGEGVNAQSTDSTPNEVRDRGGHIYRLISTLMRRVPGGGSGKPRSAASIMVGNTACVSLHTPS